MAHKIIIVIADKNTLAAPVPACTASGVNIEASAFEKIIVPVTTKKTTYYYQWTILNKLENAIYIG